MLFTRSNLTSILLAAVFTSAITATAIHAQAPAFFPGTTLVGTGTAPQSVTVSVMHGGISLLPKVLVQGSPLEDFFVAPGGTCALISVFNGGEQCTVNVVFQPKYPGLRTGVVVLQAADGSVLGETLLAGIGSGSLAVLQPGRIDTVAGNGQWIFHGDNVAAISAPIFLPSGVAVDAAGNIYIADSSNNRIRRVDALSGLITTVAGTGTPGYSGDGGAAISATVSAPAGIAIDGAGDVYFADTGNHAVRRIDFFTGEITTVTGTGAQGYTGDAGAAALARLSLPQGVSFDAAGNLYIADTGNHAVRKIDAASGTISTIAGMGAAGYNGDNMAASSAMLNSPWSLAIDAQGNIYIADLNNNRVRKVDAQGTITTVAGTGARSFAGDGSLAVSATLNNPAAVALDPAGNLYIADSGNNRVRKVIAATGKIATIAGTGSEEFGGDAGPATRAGLYGPYALFLDQSGNLFVSDVFHNRIRKISATAISLVYDTIRVSKVSPPQVEGLENDGTIDLVFSPPLLANSMLDSVTTTCGGSSLAVGASCQLGVEFAPTIIGNPVLGLLTVNSNAGNNPALVSVSGQVLTVEPTSVALTSSANPSLLNSSVSLTAAVSSADSSRSGKVTFLEGSAVLCTVAINAAGVATCTVGAPVTLTLGQHTLTASYEGDAYNAASVSSPLIQVVKQNASLSLTATPNPGVVTGSVEMTATAAATSGTPSGTVTFFDGQTQIGTAMLSGAGVGVFRSTQFTAGTHSLSAKYGGDTTNAAADSNAVSEVVQTATTVATLSTAHAELPVGIAVLLTVNVSSTNGPMPTGAVQILEGGTVLGGGILDVNGTVLVTLLALKPGSHNLVAAYGGDQNSSTATSAVLAQAVDQLPTITLLGSDASPVNAGASLTLSASVQLGAGALASGVITGDVVFTDNGIALGTATLQASGVAVINTKVLSVGPHNVVATYKGSGNYAGSASASLLQVVRQTETVTTLATGSATSLAGQFVSLTAAVTSPSGIPSGTVNFMDGAVSLGQGTLNAQGIATLSLSTLGVGTHHLTASYVGVASYSASISTPVDELVSLATTALALSGVAKIDAGLQASFAVALTGNGTSPTGSVVLHDGASIVAAQTVSGVGAITFHTLSLTVGTHTLTATYDADANNAASVSNALVVTVSQAAVSAVLVSNSNPQVVSQSVTLIATLSSTSPGISGGVSFRDGGVEIGSGVLSANGTATLTTTALPAGEHSIVAVYGGDANHLGATSLPVAELIVQSSQIALGSSANPVPSGASVVFTAKVTGPAAIVPTGAVTFQDGAALLGSAVLDAGGTASFASSSLSVGGHSVTASYTGDRSLAAVVSAPLLQVVQNASTQVALTGSADPATYGAPLTFTVAITSNGGVATGRVTLNDGTASIGSAVLAANGVATLTISTLAPGAHTILASYAGDGKASASVSAPLAISVKQLTSAAIASSSNPSPTLGEIKLTAQVSNTGPVVPSGTVAFTDGATQLGTATLDATGRGIITVPQLAAGSHPVVVSYAGDGANFSALSKTMDQSVVLRPTTTTLTATATNPADPTQVTLIAVVRWTGPLAPTGSVTLMSGSLLVGTVHLDATGVGTLNINVQSGTKSVTASYLGDAAYAASDSAATAIVAGPATQFTLNLAPAALTMVTKEHGVTTLTVASVKGFSDTLQFGCLGLPFAATCTFSKPQAKLVADGTLSVELTVDTGNPLGAGARASNIQTPSVWTALAPFALLSGCVMWSCRRSLPKPGVLLLLFCAMGALLSSTGCAGLTQAGTPPGTYSFQVTAYGEGTGASESQTMTLTVTK